jgi:predicted ATPase
MPSVLADLDLRHGSGPIVEGGGPERMLRELVLALETPVSEGILVLVLEDLHWADPSTLELVAALARRRRPARLLVIGTSRPEDDHGSDCSLYRLETELAVRDQCARLRVPPLDEAAVAAYVRARLPESSSVIEHAVYRHTEGNPLFMVNMVAHLSAQGLTAATPATPVPVRNNGVMGLGIPDNLRSFIERQLDSLAFDDRRLLEACSVAGARFFAGTVAAGLDRDPVETEEHCEALCRLGRFLQRWAAPERSGATVPRQYEFRHALYRDILYDGASPKRRTDLHRAIGLEMERSVGPNTPDLAAELALHFEQGRDPLRAARYLKQAADIALGRCANAETIQLLTRAIEAVRRLPDTPERSQQELALQVSLGAPIAATKSWAAPEVDQAYGRARSLCLSIGDSPKLFPILWGIWAFNVLRARHETARELSQELIGLARRWQDSGFLVEGHVAMGLTHAWRGEFEPALRHLNNGLDGYDPLRHRAHSFEYGQDPRMICLAHKSWVLWWLGYPDQALAASREAISWAREVSHPHSLAFATVYAAILHHFRGEYGTVLALMDEVVRLSDERSFGQWSAFARLFRGRALVAQGNVKSGIGRMERSLSAYRDTGAEWGKPFFMTLMAEAYGKGTKHQKTIGKRFLEQALALIETTHEGFYEAEVYRVLGEYSARAHCHEDAEVQFRRALDIARRRNAKSWQLRAATSLAKLWLHQDRKDEARQLLAPVYDSFTEAFDTADLKDARELLSDLG